MNSQMNAPMNSAAGQQRLHELGVPRCSSPQLVVGISAEDEEHFRKHACVLHQTFRSVEGRDKSVTQANLLCEINLLSMDRTLLMRSMLRDGVEERENPADYGPDDLKLEFGYEQTDMREATLGNLIGEMDALKAAGAGYSDEWREWAARQRE
jgi:hypothetical protein